METPLKILRGGCKKKQLDEMWRGTEEQLRQKMKDELRYKMKQLDYWQSPELTEAGLKVVDVKQKEGGLMELTILDVKAKG